MKEESLVNGCIYALEWMELAGLTAKGSLHADRRGILVDRSDVLGTGLLGL